MAQAAARKRRTTTKAAKAAPKRKPRATRSRKPAARDSGVLTRWLGMLVFAFVASAVGIGWVLGGLDPSRIASATASTGQQIERTSFSLCSYDNGNDCVVDGDTFRYRGTTIRIADIDTPEVFSYRCLSEKDLGERATDRLHVLLNAGPFALEDYERDEDQYGRKLRVVTRNGQSLGMMLVDEGLARVWDGSRHGWC